VSEPSDIKQNLADQICELFKWLCTYKSYRAISPPAPDLITDQMWPDWGRGVNSCDCSLQRNKLPG